MTEKQTAMHHETDSEWSRTTVVLREEHLQKLKILSWWEKTTLKEVFDEMIREYLSSKKHLDRFFQEREKSIQEKKNNVTFEEPSCEAKENQSTNKAIGLR